MSLREMENDMELMKECQARLLGNTSIEGRLDAVETVLRAIVGRWLERITEEVAIERGG